MFLRPGSIFSGLLALAVATPLCLTAILSQTQAQQPTADSDLRSKADQNEKVHSRVFQSSAVGTVPDLLAKTTGDLTIPNEDDMEVGSMRDVDTPPYPPSRLVELACFADAVVLAAPVAGVSHLTADKKFLYSDWTMHVDDVLQDTPKAPIDGGVNITVVRPGGRLVIDGRTVYGKAEGFPEFQTSGKYLLFLTYIPQTGAFKARTERSFDLVLDKERVTDPRPYSHLHNADPVPSASPEQLVTDTRAAIAYAAAIPNCATLRDNQ